MRGAARAVALLAALGLAPAAAAQKATVTKVARVTAKVAALDRTARTITLRGSKGATTFAVGPEVRGLDQIRVGDYVVVRYLEPALVDVEKRESAVSERVEPGAQGVPRRLTVAAEVVGKNAAKRTIALRVARQTVELKATSLEQLERIQVGDRVAATYTEPAAISVELAISRPDETRR